MDLRSPGPAVAKTKKKRRRNVKKIKDAESMNFTASTSPDAAQICLHFGFENFTQ
jgi:hypothetical protein